LSINNSLSQVCISKREEEKAAQAKEEFERTFWDKMRRLFRLKKEKRDQAPQAKAEQGLPSRKEGTAAREPPPELTSGENAMTSWDSLAVLWSAIRHSMWAWHWAMLLVVSIMGVLSSPIFFVFCVLDYFCTPGGLMIISALVNGAGRLAKAFGMGVMVIACFGVFTYCYFSQTAIYEDQTCHSPFQCVAKHVLDAIRGDITTVMGAFVAWSFPAVVVWEDLWFSVRTVFIIISILWWNFLLQPLITGIIIDSFNQLRADAATSAKAMEERCFISGPKPESLPLN